HVIALTENAGLTRKTDVEWFGLKIFTKLEVLKKSHSLSTAIIPGTPALLSIGQRPYCELPVISGFDAAGLHYATTGKTHKPGFEIGDHLSNIWAQAVGAISPGLLWKQ